MCGGLARLRRRKSDLRLFDVCVGCGKVIDVREEMVTLTMKELEERGKRNGNG